jgi:Uma2 family endonuclease
VPDPEEDHDRMTAELLPEPFLHPGEPLTPDDLLRIAYGGGRRELVDGCLVITREVGHWTPADLLELPEDNRKHELLDGQIVISPSPRPIHQRVVSRLVVALAAVLPPELEVLTAPVDVHIPHGLPTLLLPDVLVVPTITVDTELVSRPVLAVEVLSPSTRRFDLGRKRAAYARYGIGVCLVVDPLVPALTVLTLDGADYVETARGEGEALVHVDGPVVLAVSAAQLVR